MQIVCGRWDENRWNPFLTPILKTVGRIFDVPESPDPKRSRFSNLLKLGIHDGKACLPGQQRLLSFLSRT